MVFIYLICYTNSKSFILLNLLTSLVFIIEKQVGFKVNMVIESMFMTFCYLLDNFIHICPDKYHFFVHTMEHLLCSSVFYSEIYVLSRFCLIWYSHDCLYMYVHDLNMCLYSKSFCIDKIDVLSIIQYIFSFFIYVNLPVEFDDHSWIRLTEPWSFLVAPSLVLPIAKMVVSSAKVVIIPFSVTGISRI